MLVQDGLMLTLLIKAAIATQDIGNVKDNNVKLEQLVRSCINACPLPDYGIFKGR